MNLMPYRYHLLQKTIDTFQDIHAPLVVKIDNVYSAAGFGDDTGIYLFIPWVVRFFGVSLDKAIDIFFFTLIVVGFSLSVISFGIIFKKQFLCKNTVVSSFFAVLSSLPIPCSVIFGAFSINRGNALFFVFMMTVVLMMELRAFQFISKEYLFKTFAWTGLSYMTACAWYWGDLYVTEMFCVASIIPIFLAWKKESEQDEGLLYLIGVLSGLVIGFCNLIHAEGGIGALLFVTVFVFLTKSLRWPKKILICSVVVLFSLVPYAVLLNAENQRDKFLENCVTNYKPDTNSHPFWHSIYIGLGYLPNKYNIQYLDQSGMAAAMTVDPKVTLYSSEYNQILKNKIFLMLKEDFGFVARVIAAKIEMILMYIGLFANVGIFLCWKQGMKLPMLLPFLFSGFFYALPGLLVMPNQRYILGLISLSIVFGVYVTGTWMEKRSSRPSGAV